MRHLITLALSTLLYLPALAAETPPDQVVNESWTVDGHTPAEKEAARNKAQARVMQIMRDAKSTSGGADFDCDMNISSAGSKEIYQVTCTKRRPGGFSKAPAAQ